MNDLERLKANLHNIFAGPTKPEGNRTVALQARYALALANVAEFLKRSGCEQADRFTELAAAIVELTNGTVAPVLRHAKIGGRGPDGLADWSRRAMVVAGMECFIKSGKNREEAAKHVAGSPHADILGRLKRDTDASLETSCLSWLRQIRRGGKVPAIEEIRAYLRKVLDGDRPPAEWLARGDRVLAEAAGEISKSEP